MAQAAFLNAMAIAIKPGLVTMVQQPVEGLDCQTARGKTHGFSHTHEPVDGSDFRQDMGGVSPLSPTFFEPPLVFKERKPGIQQRLLSLPLNQACPKIEIRTVKSNPGSSKASPSKYFQSRRPRTASAACRSGNSSANWSTVMKASRQGLEQAFHCQETNAQKLDPGKWVREHHAV